MFACIHLTQKKGWQPVKEIIATHTNFFSSQQKHKGMISLSKKMTVTSLLHQLDADDLTKNIIREEDQIKISNNIPLIKDLEISNIFKNKDNCYRPHKWTSRLIVTRDQSGIKCIAR